MLQAGCHVRARLSMLPLSMTRVDATSPERQLPTAATAGSHTGSEQQQAEQQVCPLLGLGAHAAAWQRCMEDVQRQDSGTASCKEPPDPAATTSRAEAWAAHVAVALLPAAPASPPQWEPPSVSDQGAQQQELRRLLQQLPKQSPPAAQPAGGWAAGLQLGQARGREAPSWRSRVWAATTPDTHHPLRFAVCFLELLTWACAGSAPQECRRQAVEGCGREGAISRSAAAALGTSDPISGSAAAAAQVQLADAEALLHLCVAAGRAVYDGEGQQLLLATGMEHFQTLRESICHLSWAQAQLKRSLVAVSNRMITAEGG